MPVNPVSRKPIQPLQAHLAPLLQKLLARRGFKDERLFIAWPDIMGQELGTYSMPERIAPHPDGLTLYIRAHGAIAVQLQYLAPQILSRVHQLYGLKHIKRVAIKQGRITQRRGLT